MYSKKELERIGFKFDSHYVQWMHAVDIRFEGWTDRFQRTLRVYLRNQESECVVARPWKDGSFKNAYDVIAHFPAKGFGYASVFKYMQERHGGSFYDFYRTDPKYGDMVASAVNIARCMLNQGGD